MPTAHPQYDAMIYNGGVGETPHPGAFYIPKYGDTLSGIAKKAYNCGTMVCWGTINGNAWNRDNCTYRETSTSCKSAIVQSGGYLALCPPYPMIWIPPFGTSDTPEMQLPEGPDYRVIAPEITIELPDRPVPGEEGAGETTTGGAAPGGDEDFVPVPVEEGIPWWWYVVGAAGVLGIGYFIYRKKHKK